MSSANRQIAKAASTVMFAFVISNLVGLLRQILVSSTFGTSNELDSFYAAVTIPDLLFNLMAGGALASAFIPIFTDEYENNSPTSAFFLSSAIINLILVFLGGASLLIFFFAPNVVEDLIFLFKPDLDPAMAELTSELLKIIMIAPTIFGVSGIVMGILNTRSRFLMPALAPVFNWIGWIIGLIFFVPGMGIYGLAWGYVLGSVLHLLVQLPQLIRLPEFRYHPTLGLGQKSVHQVLSLMAPRLLGVSAVQVNFLINTMIATSLGEGSLTAINIGRMIMTMPLFVIAQAIATAALPTFSSQVAKGQKAEMRDSLTSTLRGVLLLAMPSTFGLIVLRQPLTSLLFERGEFTSHSTQLVTWAILWYTVGLIGHSIVEILSRAFYALHDTKTPVKIGVFAMGLNVGFSFLFVWMFRWLGWMSHGGLAFANSLATSIEALFLLYLVRKPLAGLHTRSITSGGWHYLLASILMSIAIIFSLQILNTQSALADSIVGVLVGLLVYPLVLYGLGNDEIKKMIGFVKSKLQTRS